MTEKIYDKNPRLLEFEAKVLSCTPVSKKGYDVVLDRTAFFPEGGGQKCDRGALFLSDCADSSAADTLSCHSSPFIVQDVQIENDTIHHFMAEPLPEGSSVSGKVDWTHRFNNMQQHSGEHIISGLVHRHFGLNNVGFHLSDTEVTLDFDGSLTEEQLSFIEQEANKAVYENLEIKASYPAAEKLAAIGYRSKIELTGAVRIVEIPGYDICACCAPHVAYTGEIGIIKITDCMNYKGGVRLNILCGRRALDDYRTKQKTVSSLSVLLSSKPEKIMTAVQQINDDRFALRGQVIEAQKALLQLKIDTAPSGTSSLFLFLEPLDNSAVHFGINQMTERFPGFCGIFLSDGAPAHSASGFRFQIASGQNDCRALLAKWKERFTVKGGGSEKAIQGRINASRTELDDFFASWEESGLCIR